MDFENMSITDLKQLAKDTGIKNISKLKKQEIIEMLSRDNTSASNNLETISEIQTNNIVRY